MNDRWHVPRHHLAYLLIRLAALVLLIILITTGQLTELVMLFMPVVAMVVVVWVLAYRRTVGRARRWWHHDKHDG